MANQPAKHSMNEKVKTSHGQTGIITKISYPRGANTPPVYTITLEDSTTVEEGLDG